MVMGFASAAQGQEARRYLWRAQGAALHVIRGNQRR